MVKKTDCKKRRISMNVVLCDDNPTFLNDFHHRLQSVAAQCDWVCQYTLYHNPVELLAADLSNTDIIFLDIDMPGINGIQAGRELRERHPDLIIVFVTGFIQYALDGYSVEAFRFLLKDSLQTELIACVRDIQKKLYEKQASVLIRGVEYSRPVQLQDIIYFEGTSQRHSIMHIKHGTMECLGKLSEYEAHLQHRGFLRIQRSYLVNMFHVNCIKNYHVYLSTGGRLKVSERNYQDIIAKYLRWKGKQL